MGMENPTDKTRHAMADITKHDRRQERLRSAINFRNQNHSPYNYCYYTYLYSFQCCSSLTPCMPYNTTASCWPNAS